MDRFETAKQFFFKGLGLQQKNLLSDAEAMFLKSLEFLPDRPSTLINLAKVQFERGKFNEARASAERAVEVDPSNAISLNQLGATLTQLGSHEKALSILDRAVKLDIELYQAHCNRGNALKELGRLDEAVASYDKAIAIKPDYAEAYSNRGKALRELKRLDDALASCDKAIAIMPDFAEAYWCKSLTHLLNGQFTEGWNLYDWRWRTNNFSSKPLVTSRPLYNPMSRGTVLVWPEQGVGDEVMFGSMISELQSFCDKLIVILDKRLVPLFSRSMSSDIMFVSKGSSVSENLYDQHIPIGNLAKYLRNSEAAYAPARSGYLSADSARSREARQFLVSKTRKKLCGISWYSKNEKSGKERSLTLISFLKYLSPIDCDYVNLQYGETTEEIDRAREELGIDVIRYHRVDNFHDLDGFAALIQACDFVVSIDNSTVHLAGALGQDVRVLLPNRPDFRWQLEREDSPWYESVKLYRQSEDGDWSSAFKKLTAELKLSS